MIRKAAIFVTCLLLNFTLTSAAKAEEIVISVEGNGSNATNEVQVQTQTTTQVNQNNNAQVTNNVDTNANTGNNTANQNTGGDTSITTGDAATDTNISNENINSNAASVVDCCNGGTTINLSGNGANSTNIGVYDNNYNHIVSQNNYASINNNITVNANTGLNSASYNGGNATIKTGNIKAVTNISNKNINNSYYDGVVAMMGNSSVIIKGNGADSFNLVTLNDNTNILISNNNLAEILNNVEQNLNTGGNETLKNLGDVAILTGDIKSTININNENINSNFVKVDCNCDKPENPPATPPTGPTPTPGSSIVQGASGSSGSSSSGGPAAGSVLPVTGNPLPFTFIATFIFLFMFLSGLYLRFNAAHGPPTK